jgi:hypothetical protein
MMTFEQFQIRIEVERFITTPLGIDYVGKLKHIMRLIGEIMEETDDTEFTKRHTELKHLDHEEIDFRQYVPLWMDVQEYLAK